MPAEPPDRTGFAVDEAVDPPGPEPQLPHRFNERVAVELGGSAGI